MRQRQVVNYGAFSLAAATTKEVVAMAYYRSQITKCIWRLMETVLYYFPIFVKCILWKNTDKHGVTNKKNVSLKNVPDKHSS